MKFDLKLWLIVGLTAIIILLILFDKPQEHDTSAWQDEIHRKNTKIKELQAKHIEDSVKFSQEMAVLNEELSGKDTQVRKLAFNLERLKKNPIVIKVRDSVPVIDSVFLAYDSVIQVKDEQLEIQGKMIVSLEDENQRITSNFLERLQLQSENLATQKEIIDDQRKELRKERRKVKLLKVVAVVGTVGAFILGAGL